MRTIIFGGRDYSLSAPHWRFLDSIHEKYGLVEVIQGEASGADAGGKLWALKKGIDVVGFYSNWVKYDKSAGPRRNAQMLQYLLTGGKEEESIAGIEFPGMAGTADMSKRLVEAGVHIFKYKGPVSQKIT